MSRNEYWTRRLVLQRGLQLGAMGVAAPLAINLAAIGEAAAFDTTDYKALVCMFLYGGNDYANTVVPYDPTNYALYHQIRAGAAGEDQAGIALARAALAPTALTPNNGQVLTDNLQYALAPQLAGLKGLWDAGKLAVQLNVGPLIQPTTLAQYLSTNKVANPLPPKLFSHNDQQSIWQANGSEGATIGWGGRLGDIALSSNSNTPNSLLTCISASGNAVFVAGRDALQYQTSPNGAIKIRALDPAQTNFAPFRDAVNALITRTSNHVLENEYAIVTRRSIQMEGTVNSALAPVQPTTVFPASNPLGNQLKIVARLIGARGALNMRRQVFFVSLGRLRQSQPADGRPSGAAPAYQRCHERVLRRHRGARSRQQRHHVHRVGFRAHAELERGRFRSWLGLAPFRDGRRRQRRPLLRNRAACFDPDR